MKKDHEVKLDRTEANMLEGTCFRVKERRTTNTEVRIVGTGTVSLAIRTFINTVWTH